MMLKMTYLEFSTISTALAWSDILDYLSGIGTKIFSKITEPLKTVFSLKNPNMRILLIELQIRSESFGWNPLFQINISQEIYNPYIQNLLSTHIENAQFRIYKEKLQHISTQIQERGKIITSNLCSWQTLLTMLRKES
jgi:hypothetical protein